MYIRKTTNLVFWHSTFSRENSDLSLLFVEIRKGVKCYKFVPHIVEISENKLGLQKSYPETTEEMLAYQ